MEEYKIREMARYVLEFASILILLNSSSQNSEVGARGNGGTFGFRLADS